eukprot:134838-Pyramimonas_sp.AAC.1
MEIPDKTMTSILDAYHQCRTQFGPAKELYSDGEGALNNDTAKAALNARVDELRMRARRQRATTTEAKNDELRHLLRAMETELRRLDILVVHTTTARIPVGRQCMHLLRCGVSMPCFVWTVACSGSEQPTEMSGHSREQ